MPSIIDLKPSDRVLLVDNANKTCLKSPNITCVNCATVSTLSGIFDVVIVPASINHQDTVDGLTSKFLELLKPGGKFYLYVRGNEDNRKRLEVNLLIAGFVNISSNNDGPFKLKLENSVEEIIFPESAENVVCIQSQKPNYEIGSSKPISISNEKVNVAAIWKLQDSADDLIEDDDLLDEEDLKKPDSSSLRVCGTTGKRKACKDCSCGLAEELENEKAESKKDTANAKSSCGNCYLGDAFRCASCPYLGMPAFKPGEKIQLSDQFLSPDI